MPSSFVIAYTRAPRACAVAEARIASARHDAVYVFVAATARSRPHRRRNVASAARASAERGAFVSASVNAPSLRAAFTTAATSGELPDCEIPMTAPPAKRGAASYRVTSDGAADAVTMPAALSKRYFP